MHKDIEQLARLIDQVKDGEKAKDELEQSEDFKALNERIKLGENAKRVIGSMTGQVYTAGLTNEPKMERQRGFRKPNDEFQKRLNMVIDIIKAFGEKGCRVPDIFKALPKNTFKALLNCGQFLSNNRVAIKESGINIDRDRQGTFYSFFIEGKSYKQYKPVIPSERSELEIQDADNKRQESKFL